MTKRTGGGAKPRITLTANDHEKLSVLANAAAHTMPEVAAELADELDRAHVLAIGPPSRRHRLHGLRGRFPRRHDRAGADGGSRLPEGGRHFERTHLGADPHRHGADRVARRQIDRLDHPHRGDEASDSACRSANQSLRSPSPLKRTCPMHASRAMLHAAPGRVVHLCLLPAEVLPPEN